MFYDIGREQVNVLGIVTNAQAQSWLRPAGVLIGFETEDDWLDYRLEHNPEFLRRIAQARLALERGEGIRLEDAEPRRPRPKRQQRARTPRPTGRSR